MEGACFRKKEKKKQIHKFMVSIKKHFLFVFVGMVSSYILHFYAGFLGLVSQHIMFTSIEDILLMVEKLKPVDRSSSEVFTHNLLGSLNF